MSQQMNMNEKPPLERKETPLYNLFADKDDQLGQEKWKEPTEGRTIEIREVEYRYPEAGQEIPASTEKPSVLEGAKDKLRQGVEKAKATFTSDKPADAEWTEENKPGVMEGAKEKLRQGVEKAKATFTSDKPTTTYTSDQSVTTTPGVLQGAKNMVWQGVEKAKGLISSTQSTEQHPGNGYDWKRVVDEQGQVCWVATNDWSNRGGLLEGAKEKLRQGVEKAKATFTSEKPADAEWTEENKPGVMEGAKEKLRQGVEKAKATFTTTTTTTPDSELTENKSGVLQGAKNMVWQGVEKAKGLVSSTQSTEQHPGNGYNWKRVTGEQGQVCWVATNDWSSRGGLLEGAKDKLRQGVEMAKATFTSDKSTTDSELTENKPGVIERVKGVFSSGSSDSEYTDQNKPGVLQGAKDMVLQGVEKAKGLMPSTKITAPTELHPGTGYDWKRVVGEQGQVSWVAPNDWSSDSSNRGILEGAKGMVRSGVEKAKGVFATKDAKSEVTDYPQTGLLQGAKAKVWQGVEKAKSVFSSAPTEQHPGRSYTWHKTTGPQGQPHWEARFDFSNDSANQQNKSNVIQGAKDKVQGAKDAVWHGVEKAKGMLPSAKSETTTTTEPTVKGWEKFEGQQVVEGSNFKTTTGYKGQTQTGTEAL